MKTRSFISCKLSNGAPVIFAIKSLDAASPEGNATSADHVLTKVRVNGLDMVLRRTLNELCGDIDESIILNERNGNL